MSIQVFNDKQKAFNQILMEYRQFGTGDTEVQRKKTNLLQSLYNLDAYIYIPKTAAQWELYTSIKGVDIVAQKLTKAAKEMVAAFDKITVADLKKIKGILIFDKETVAY